MADRSDGPAEDRVGGFEPVAGSARRKPTGARPGQERLDGLVRPVNYARSRERYRPPPELYRRLNRWLGPAVTSLGLAPPGVVAVRVPGRCSGVIRQTTVVRAVYGGGHCLVSLAGESGWVRNVRAAGGQVVIGGRHRRAARLTGVPPGRRAPVIRAYLLRWGRRPGSRAVALEARRYFGVGADAALEEIQGVVQYYPVFRIGYADRAAPQPADPATRPCRVAPFHAGRWR